MLLLGIKYSTCDLLCDASHCAWGTKLRYRPTSYTT